MKQSLMKFPNGLRVILSSRQSNVVTLSLSVLFGAEQEKKNSSGVTRLIERLMRGMVAKEMEELGGIVESRTDYEHFEITISTVRENLDKAFKCLSKAVFDFRPTYQNFRVEQARLMQEVENRKSSPLMILSDTTQKNRYKTTSLATELYGTSKSLREITLEFLRDYYKSILSSENLMLSVVGNISDEASGEEKSADDNEFVSFEAGESLNSNVKSISAWNEIYDDPDAINRVVLTNYNYDSLNYIKELVTKEFYSRTMNLPKTVRRRSTAYFPLKEATIVVKNKNLNQSRFQISLPSAPYSSSGYRYSKLFELYLSNYLKHGITGEDGIYGLNVYLSQFKNNAHINIVFAVDYDKAEEAFNKMLDLLRGQRQESISMGEFKSLMMSYKTIISLGNEKMSDLARRYNKWFFLKGELFNLNNELKAVSALNFDSFREIAKKMINFDSMLVVYLGKPLEEGALKIN